MTPMSLSLDPSISRELAAAVGTRVLPEISLAASLDDAFTMGGRVSSPKAAD
jgi:hypothetical protein